jgi:hypothetical protein
METGKRVPQGRPSSKNGFRQGQVVLSPQTARAVQALLKDLRQLLDDYGPAWYSEDLSARLSDVLKELDKES